MDILGTYQVANRHEEATTDVVMADPFLVHQVEASTGSMWLLHKSFLYPVRHH